MTSGTSGSSGCLVSESWTSTIIFFSSIHDLCVAFTLDHDQPQRPLHLAALHRQHDIVAAGIAFDDLEMRPEHAVEHPRELIGVGAGAGAADRQFLGEQVLEFGNAGILYRHADADFVVGAADPAEFLRVERIGLADQQRIEGDAAAEGTERGPSCGATR